MSKTFSKFEIAVIKRTAQNVNPMVTKKTKLLAQMEEIKSQVEELQKMIDQYEAAILSMTGGFSTEDLVTKVKDENSGMAKYVLKYPDTVVPSTSNEEEFVASMEEVADATEEIEDPYAAI